MAPKPYFEKIKWNWTIEEIDSVVISNTISRMRWWKSGVRSYVPTHEPESKAPSPGFAGTIAGYEHWGLKALGPEREGRAGPWSADTVSPGPGQARPLVTSPGHSQSVRGWAVSIRCEWWPTVTIIPCADQERAVSVVPKASQTGYFSLLVSRPSQSVDAQTIYSPVLQNLWKHANHQSCCQGKHNLSVWAANVGEYPGWDVPYPLHLSIWRVSINADCILFQTEELVNKEWEGWKQ